MEGNTAARNKQYEHMIRTANGLILRYGVIISITLIALGTLDAFINPHFTIPETVSGLLASNVGMPILNYSSLWNALASFEGLGIVQIGVLVLLATPIVRVAVSTVIFAAERDRAYIIIGIFVLLVLLFSVFLVGPFEASIGSSASLGSP